MILSEQEQIRREALAELRKLGINPYRYNTTCPFVEKVWNRSEQLGNDNFTVIIHGKSYHEETRATFSHSKTNAASVIVRDIQETKLLASFILDEKPKDEFYKIFSGKLSEGFNIEKDLFVVLKNFNQVTFYNLSFISEFLLISVPILITCST